MVRRDHRSTSIAMVRQHQRLHHEEQREPPAAVVTQQLSTAGAAVELGAARRRATRSFDGPQDAMAEAIAILGTSGGWRGGYLWSPQTRGPRRVRGRAHFTAIVPCLRLRGRAILHSSAVAAAFSPTALSSFAALSSAALSPAAARSPAAALSAAACAAACASETHCTQRRRPLAAAVPITANRGRRGQ